MINPGRRPLITGIIIGVLLSAGALAFFLWGPFSQTSPKQEPLTVISSRLMETAPQQTFRTAEGVFSFIFPFDFFAKGSRWDQALSTGAQALRDPSTATPAHKEVWAYFQLAQKYGLDKKPKESFFVFQVLAKAGVNLQGKTLQWASAVDQDKSHPVLILPDVTLTDLVFLEQDAKEAAQWPDFALGPGAWKELSDLLKPSVTQMILDRKILDEARINAQDFFQGFYKAAGMDDLTVQFTPPAP